MSNIVVKKLELTQANKELFNINYSVYGIKDSCLGYNIVRHVQKQAKIY